MDLDRHLITGKIRSRTAQMEQALLCELHHPPVDVEAQLQVIRNRKALMAEEKAKRGGRKASC